MARSLASHVACAWLLAACAAAGPDFTAPAAPAMAGYTAHDPTRADAGAAETSQRIAPSKTTGPSAPAAWWSAFESSALDRMVELALAHSPALQAARATLAQAEAAAKAARGNRSVQIGIEASAGRASAGNISNRSAIGPTLSQQVDAFGATERRIEQAQALADAQYAQWLASRLSLAGNTVRQTINLASAIEQTRAVQDILTADRRNLDLVQIATSAGKTAGLDVLTAQSQLASDRTLLPPLLQQAGAARHALALLVGQTAAAWSPPDVDFDTLALPVELPLRLPSDLVRRRPDILAAEAQLHAASAAIGIAAAQLYPSITLSASWTAGGEQFFAHTGGAWNLAAGLAAPLFNGGTLRAQRDAASHAYAAQLATYRQTVLQAFAQVADVLLALENDAALLDAQRKALDAARETLDLTQQSYQAGQASFLQIIEAQRLYQRARLGHVQAKAQRYIDSLQLFVAMGGAGTDAAPLATTQDTD